MMRETDVSFVASPMYEYCMTALHHFEANVTISASLVPYVHKNLQCVEAKLGFNKLDYP